MAKPLGDGKYKPGVIYRLCFEMDGDWIPFYVGESHKPDQRYGQHRDGGEGVDERNVYQAIRQMNADGTEWKMHIVDNYDEYGPSALEDEWVLQTLAEGYTLTNMKRGNARWMEQKLAEVAEMKSLNLTARQYRERKKAELMVGDTVIEASAMAAKAKATGRRRESPELVKARKKAAKWSRLKVVAHINNLRVNGYKYGATAFGNLLNVWEQVLEEKEF